MIVFARGHDGAAAAGRAPALGTGRAAAARVCDAVCTGRPAVDRRPRRPRGGSCSCSLRGAGGATDHRSWLRLGVHRMAVPPGLAGRRRVRPTAPTRDRRTVRGRSAGLVQGVHRRGVGPEATPAGRTRGIPRCPANGGHFSPGNLLDAPSRVLLGYCQVWRCPASGDYLSLIFNLVGRAAAVPDDPG